MAKHMEWSEERSPQWQYLLGNDRVSKRNNDKREKLEEPTVRRRSRAEKRKFKKTLKNGKTVTVFWSSSETEQQQKDREEKDNAES